MINKVTTTLVLMMLFQTLACTQQLQPGWQLDVQKSKVLWNTGKTMGGHYGYFLFQYGNLEFSATGEPVRGTFYMDMNSIRTTDNPNKAEGKKKDAALRDNDFFASDQYPIATMVVQKITRIGSSTDYTVAGELTIKGITQPIEFRASIVTQGKTSHITAKVDIARQLWNIHAKPKPVSTDFLSGIKEKLVPDIHVSLDIFMKQ
jgi:polyisoprenoid-binding protein YceI